LRADVRAIQWFHQMTLAPGITTLGVYEPARRLQRIGLPERLDGLTVLDVGAWDGFYSFEAERRGAARVLATDWFSWGGDGWGTKAGFELARRALASRVEDADINVMDLRADTIGTFDLVLFLGVLYHLRDPVTAIERVASVTGGRLILETEVGLRWLRRPAAEFFPTTELKADPTNWWAPNPAWIRGMLERSGFQKVVTYSRLPLRDRVWGSISDRSSQGVRRRLRQRMVFHASRQPDGAS